MRALDIIAFTTSIFGVFLGPTRRMIDFSGTYDSNVHGISSDGSASCAGTNGGTSSAWARSCRPEKKVNAIDAAAPYSQALFA